MSLIDYTSLKGDETEREIEKFCQEAIEFSVAGVCVYPYQLPWVAKYLKGSEIEAVSVATGFPHSELPLELKLKEVEYLIKNGASEIDIVISQSALREENGLAGSTGSVGLVGLDCSGSSSAGFARAEKEIREIKNICGSGVKLKVILETGKLKEISLIEAASAIAMNAGADFIKTSTGKIYPGVCKESFEAMLSSIKKFKEKTGKLVGIKAAGGINTIEEVVNYYKLAEEYMGEAYMTKEKFRIGSSRIPHLLWQEINK